MKIIFRGTILVLLGLSIILVFACSSAVTPPAPAPAPAPSPAPTQTRSQVTIDMLAMPTGGLGYMVAFQLSKVLEEMNHPWLRLSPQETSGPNYNAQFMAENKDRWTDTIFNSGVPAIDAVRQQNASFSPTLDQIRFGAVHSIFGPIFFQTLDPNIRTPQDMVGKKIGLGKKAQTAWGIGPENMLKVWGIADKVQIEWLGPDVASKALIDGMVDVCVTGGISGQGPSPRSLPLLPFSDALAAGKTVYIISPTKEEATQAAKMLKGQQAQGLPPGALELPKGAEVVGLDKEVWGLGDVWAFVAAMESFPDDIMYEVVITLLDNYEELWPVHAQATLLNPATLSFGIAENIHPGALKAYQDWAEANPNNEFVPYLKQWGVTK